MRVNYHTHTPRCCHAVGSEREYAQAAMEAGLEILGFSDHTPYFFEGTDYYSRFRMRPEELEDYVRAVTALRKELKGRLEIHLGVEAEFYPKAFLQLMELLRAQGVEYTILGQHFLENETDGPYSGSPTGDSRVLDRYCGQCIEAMQTGLFTYFAHPDLLFFTGSQEEYRRQARRLCRAAAEARVPMEINLLGLQENRHYPNEVFWQVAGEEGVEAILGCDAHSPAHLLNPAAERQALELAERCSLRLVQTVPLRSL